MSKRPFLTVCAVLCCLALFAGCKTASKKTADPSQDPSKMTAAELEAKGDSLVSERGKSAEAVAVYALALEKGGDRARLKYKQGFVMLRDGQWQAASERFEESLAVSPEDVQTLLGAAFAAFKLGDYPRAESRLARAVAVRPDLPGAHNLLGIVHNQLKRPELAVADFKAAIALSGPNADLQNNLGISYFMIRDYVRAEQSLRLALAGGPNPKAANNLGLALCRQKKFDEAFAAFKQAGGEAAAYNNTGVCYADEGNKAKATEYFHKAVELSPKYYAAAERNLSQTSGQPGGRDAALEALTLQTSPAGDLAASPKVVERGLPPEPAKPELAAPAAPAPAAVLPPEAVAPHEWPAHAPLREKAEAAPAKAAKDKAPALPAAPAPLAVSPAPLAVSPAPSTVSPAPSESPESKTIRFGKEAKAGKDQARQAKEQPQASPPPAQPVQDQPAPAMAKPSPEQGPGQAEAAKAAPETPAAPLAAVQAPDAKPEAAAPAPSAPPIPQAAPQAQASKPEEPAAPAPAAESAPSTAQTPPAAKAPPEDAGPAAVPAEPKAETKAAEPAEVKADPAAPAAPAKADAAPAQPAKAKAAKVETRPGEPGAGRVVQLRAYAAPDGYRVAVTTSAPVEKAEAFAKKSPPAVGIDLFGKWSAPAGIGVAGGEDFVDKVRVGAHEDRLRIMIDLKSDQIRRKPTLEKQQDGVVILFGTSK